MPVVVPTQKVDPAQSYKCTTQYTCIINLAVIATYLYLIHRERRCEKNAVYIIYFVCRVFNCGGQPYV